MYKRVWYASYGSNLLRERFMKYIDGGAVPGSKLIQVGCTDSTPPIDDVALTIPHPLYFSGSFLGWNNMGAAFIRSDSKPGSRTYGRAYLIATEQFKEIVLQENGHRTFDMVNEIDLEKTVEYGRSTIPARSYSRLLYLGDRGSYPTFTFTADIDDDQVVTTRPGSRYITVITRGLRETHSLSDDEIARYFARTPGVNGVITQDELVSIVAAS